jgi:hypothetical protein
MALPVGTFSMNDVNVEIGNPGTSQIALNDPDVRTIAEKLTPATEISMDDLRGKSFLNDPLVMVVNTNLSPGTTVSVTLAGTGKPKSFLQVAKEVALLHDARIEIIPFPDHLRSHYQTYTCADMSLTDSMI